MTRTQDNDADLRARIAAGLVLGELGDPRFEPHNGPHGDFLLPPMIEIPGGFYRIGSNEEGTQEDEKPHKVKIKPFAMAKFPVTNSEWALFIESGGYDDERWWDTEAAKAWQRGETTAEAVKQGFRENRLFVKENYDALSDRSDWTPEQIEDWRDYANMSYEAFEKLLEQYYPPGRQTKPAFWGNVTLNRPMQPAIGISWFEARAYCAWLSTQTNLTFRLPTEAEWEAAARGFNGRLYAYGDKFDTSRCNTSETHIRRTTPVGVFSGGDTPEGLVDMTGNIWEWTSSLYRDYPYKSDDGREELADDSTQRVVRGGSWRNHFGDARASFRLVNWPSNRGYRLGVRLVCASHI